MLSAEALSRMNGEPNADENREGGIKAERGTGTEISGVAVGGDEGEGETEGERESAVWTRSTGDMSHGEQSPRGLVGAVYKWK